ncbi:hypothetical protein ACFQ7F_07635 [Streptomyces sp. NPDC056486]|uniref:hypothetical protein n=1 Tax=Streptomyces sp. NPDC056486 TaxID=3345835 RepID=UPI0036B16EF5
MPLELHGWSFRQAYSSRNVAENRRRRRAGRATWRHDYLRAGTTTQRWASREALAAQDATPHMIEADAASPAFRASPAQVVMADAEFLA